MLTRLLHSAGHEVTGLDSNLFERCTFAGGGAIEPVPTIRKDIRDLEPGDLAGHDAVLHRAALSNDPLGDLNPDLTYDINHLASVRLARMAKGAGVPRFVFSSSCSYYGAGGEGLLTEEAGFNPVTPYGMSKVKVEQDVSELADSRFSPVFLRNATAYGVSPRLRFDLVLNNLTAWAYATGKVLIKSDGTAWRPIVHIEDISRAFVAALEAPVDAVHNQSFNIGRTGENYRVSELAEIVRDTVPGTEIEYAPGGTADTRCYRVDCGKAETTLPGFRPQWTARAGAEELYRAFLDTELTTDDFEGIRYKRIAHIRQLMADGELTPDLRWAYQPALTAATLESV